MGTRGKERRRFCLPEAAFPVRDVGGMRSRGAGANTIPWRLHVEPFRSKRAPVPCLNSIAVCVQVQVLIDTYVDSSLLFWR
ncbi:hypothetical protein BRADI_5g12198v3 [Brachypodium distachyon]|uniref:Uncharacterized protein n=1 Tax=Brachypodium distachyon TaxID=15368 RepID=A0A2K2CGS5_BRADI|nr:hypothetical protein BRADI_5g12198v3 [Brachypodium distachyon]